MQNTGCHVTSVGTCLDYLGPVDGAEDDVLDDLPPRVALAVNSGDGGRAGDFVVVVARYEGCDVHVEPIVVDDDGANLNHHLKRKTNRFTKI